MFEEIAATIIGQGVVYALLVVMGLIVVDTLLGVVKAVSSGSFDVRLLADYLKTGVLPYVGALVILGAGALYVQPELLGAIFAASAIAAIVKFITDIIDKSKAMTGAGLEAECSTCGEAMAYNMSNFEGEPICESCREREKKPAAEDDDEEGGGSE